MLYRISAGLLATGLCAACSPPPPSTAPTVVITSPTSNAHLPAGMPVPVLFRVTGIDPASPVGAGGKMPQFQLAQGDGKQPGVGQVVAFFDSSNVQARTNRIPTQDAPFLVPDPVVGDPPAQIVVPGTRTISLYLRYNDDTAVPGSQPGEVTVIIQ